MLLSDQFDDLRRHSIPSESALEKYGCGEVPPPNVAGGPDWYRKSPMSMYSSVTTPPDPGEKATRYSHFVVDGLSSTPYVFIRGTRVSSIPEKQICVLPPRTPSHTSLVALFGFPLRTSPIVKPLPMPSSTRSASRKFDFPLALVPTNKFTRPNVRSTLRRLLKFSTTIRSIICSTLDLARPKAIIPGGKNKERSATPAPIHVFKHRRYSGQ